MDRVVSLPRTRPGLLPLHAGRKLMFPGVQPSMTGASYCCHVTLLILLLVPRLAFANINTPTTLSSTSPSASSSTSSSQSSSPPSLRDTQWHSLNQQERFPPSDSQPGHTESLSDLNTPSSVMPTSPSQTSDHASKPMQELTLSKRAKFKLTATKNDKNRLKAVEKLFLKNIGLQKRPKIDPEFAVPSFMLDLYNSQKENTRRSNAYLKVKGNGNIAANTVRSFVHTDADNAKCQPPVCHRVHFDITTIPEHEVIAGAELRIYVAAAETVTKGGSSPDPSFGSVELAQSTSKDGAVYSIEVHEIMQPHSDNGDVISRLLDTQVVSHGNASWHSFDIRPAVLRWKRGGNHNHGLEVRLIAKNSDHSAHHQVRLRRSIHLPDTEWALQRPLLVTYTNDGLMPSSSSASSSSSRSTRLTRLKRKRRQTSEEDNKNNKRKNKKNKKKKKKRRRKKKGNKNICQRHELYVDFNDVGWDDWIVAPTGYSAYYCHGDCMAPLPQFTKASNHAILQARVYKVNSGAVPMVCCVPTKMSPISMLYRDEKGRTVLKNYQDMAVEECSCK